MPRRNGDVAGEGIDCLRINGVSVRITNLRDCPLRRLVGSNKVVAILRGRHPWFFHPLTLEYHAREGKPMTCLKQNLVKKRRKPALLGSLAAQGVEELAVAVAHDGDVGFDGEMGES